MKTRKTLSKENKKYIDKLLAGNDQMFISQEMLEVIKKETGLTRMAIKHQIYDLEFDYNFGYSWGEFDNKTPGKARVYFRCKTCNCKYSMLAIKLRGRTYSNDPICPDHYAKIVTSSKVWREKNRSAQLVSQNLPEAKEKQRVSQLRRHAQPGMKEKYRQIGLALRKDPEYAKRVSSSLREKWKDPEYANKVMNNSKQQYHGSYSGMRYQSLIELSFILWMVSVKRNIGRYNLEGIKWDGNRSYYPDFIVDGNLIVEVKGTLKGFMYQREDEIKRKQSALIEWCKDRKYEQRIVVKKDIPKEFYEKARKVHDKINL